MKHYSNKFLSLNKCNKINIFCFVGQFHKRKKNYAQDLIRLQNFGCYNVKNLKTL